MAMSVGAQQLQFFLDNDQTLYRQQGVPILKNLALKKAKGIYEHDKAVKLYMYYMESGAKKYAKDNGGGAWNILFPRADREQAATAFAKNFETECGAGNYRDYLPKKYQAAAKPAPKKRR